MNQVRTCSVPSCINYYGTRDKSVRFFRKPHDEQRAAAWRIALYGEDTGQNIQTVCELHFDEMDIHPSGRLLRNVVPLRVSRPSADMIHVKVERDDDNEEIEEDFELMEIESECDTDESSHGSQTASKTLGTSGERDGCTHEAEILKLRAEVEMLRLWARLQKCSLPLPPATLPTKDEQAALSIFSNCEVKKEEEQKQKQQQQQQQQKEEEDEDDGKDSSGDDIIEIIEIQDSIIYIIEEDEQQETVDATHNENTLGSNATTNTLPIPVKMFECGVCGEKFEFSKGLGNHIFTKHYFDERFPQNRRERAECYLCKEQLKSIPAARKHIVNKHILQLRKRCGICDVGLTTAVKKHSCAGLKLDCEYCSKSFNSLHRLKGHLISHAAKSSYTCDICSAQYQMLAFMENHRLSHSREYFNCSQCPEKFSTFSERQMHMPTHSKNPKKCEKEIPTPPRPKPPPKIKQFECFLCKYQFKSYSGLRRHMTCKHTKPLKQPCKICDELADETKHSCSGLKLDCEYCSMVFDSLHRLNAHLDDDHVEKLFHVCDICRKPFPMRSFMEHHKSKHSPGCFACKKCPEKFDNITQIRRHRMSSHQDGRTHLCELCGKSFFTAYSLKHHTQSHMPKDYKCTHCSYATSLPLSLHIHMKRYHLKRLLYNCHVCNKQIFDRCTLQKHMEIHTRTEADRTHACSLCPKKFFDAKAVGTHIRAVHKNDGRSLKCSYCEKAFKHRTDLTKHLRTHLGDKMYKCPDCSEGFRKPWDLKRHSFVHYVAPNTDDTNTMSSTNPQKDNLL